MNIEIEKYPTAQSAISTILLGSLIPLLSSIMPVQAVLQLSLVDAIDTQRSKTKALCINILMANRKDVTNLVIFGLILLTYGFGVYYLLPLSLVSFNFSLASTIFLGVLFGMITALGVLSMNTLPMLNLIVSKILLIFE